MDQRNINSTMTVILTTLVMSKQDYTIQSGNGTIELTAIASNESYLWNGDIVFNGGNTATITINGTAYDIDWNL